MNNKINIFQLIAWMLLPFSVFAEDTTFFQLQKATLTELNPSTSMLYFNNRTYIYKPDKAVSIYRSVDNLESIDIGDLNPDTEYYFEILFEETKTATGYHDKPIAVIFIANEKPPE